MNTAVLEQLNLAAMPFCLYSSSVASESLQNTFLLPIAKYNIIIKFTNSTTTTTTTTTTTAAAAAAAVVAATATTSPSVDVDVLLFSVVDWKAVVFCSFSLFLYFCLFVCMFFEGYGGCLKFKLKPPPY